MERTRNKTEFEIGYLSWSPRELLLGNIARMNTAVSLCTKVSNESSGSEHPKQNADQNGGTKTTANASKSRTLGLAALLTAFAVITPFLLIAA
jgi:hypothetical protein